MKSRNVVLAIAVTVVTAMTIPTGLAAQDDAAQAKKAQHHHYKLIVLGTLGGPQSYGDAGHGAANITNKGVAAGDADTNIPDPFYPNFNPLLTRNQFSSPFVFHAFTSSGGALTDLGSLAGANSSTPTFITNNGLVAGQSLNGKIDPLTGWPQMNAVLWKNGQIINLGTLGGYESSSFKVNRRGQVVGNTTNSVPDPYFVGTQVRAFLWDEKNGMQDLGTLGGPDAGTADINEHGQIVGFSFTSFTPNPNTMRPTQEPFLLEKNGKMIDLGTLGGTIGGAEGINNRGQVFGISNLSGDTETHGFFWENGQLTDIGTLGGTVISPSAMNEKGVIVGQSTVASGEFHAFFWRRGLMTDLGPLPGFGDTTCIGAFGINSHDQVVGQAEFNLCDPTHAQAAHAFLWENGSMIDLNTFVPKGTDIKLNEVEQINDSGEMFGIGTLPDGNNRAFLLIPCDDDHPDVEGCDYDMVDESDMPATQMATTAKPVLSPDAIRQLMQSAGRHSKLWYRGFGAQTQPK